MSFGWSSFYFCDPLPCAHDADCCYTFNSEISQKDFNAQDSKGPRSFSKFLLKITELSPRIVLKQISLLLTHLDSEVSLARLLTDSAHASV